MWFMQSLEAMWAIVTLTAMTAPVSVPTWLWLRNRKRTRAAWVSAEAAAMWEVHLATPSGADALVQPGVRVVVHRVARVGDESRTIDAPHRVATVLSMHGHPLPKPNPSFQADLDAAVEHARTLADTLNSARYS